MQSKHRKILENPIRPDIRWEDIESLLMALGATIIQKKGSRLRIYLNGRVGTFHRPHPSSETDKGAVKSVRRFLQEAGEMPCI